ncbi:hypothetical protein CK203_001865 [Vitis vinifera]|uniref:Uncharacterized protein n=1 Tax=Vitis vinifera TaxID=29760 RepID=A0A438KJ76_VITVI|nr:hypothetical protein CK203_001865 [Vitis vinifera]
MTKRRVKKTVKQSAASSQSNINDANAKEPQLEKRKDSLIDQEVERQSAAIRAIRDVESEHLRTRLRLLRSYFKKEQLRTPVLEFFKENLPNLEVVRNGKGQFEVQWKDEAMRNAGGENMHVALLHQMSIAYPDCSAAVPSFGGFEFSSKAVKTSLLGADNLQIRDFANFPISICFLSSVVWLKKSKLMAGIFHGLGGAIRNSDDGIARCFPTPGVSSHRFSVGMTPKTLRLPKHGEMLLSVHGSPLGLYKEDNMEAIHESEEG